MNVLASVQTLLFGLLLVWVMILIPALFGYAPMTGHELYERIHHTPLDDTIRAQRATLSERHRKWLERRPQTYQYELQRLCFCIPPYDDVRVTVDSGRVTAVQRIATRSSGFPGEDDSLRVEDFETLDELFQRWMRAVQRADDVQIVYDSTQIAPTSVEIDWVLELYDDEITYGVTVHAAPPKQND